jgi:hypothetical protein
MSWYMYKYMVLVAQLVVVIYIYIYIYIYIINVLVSNLVAVVNVKIYDGWKVRRNVMRFDE